YAACKQAREGFARLDRDEQAASDDEHVESEQAQCAEKPKFLSHDGEDEVRIPLRKKFKLGLAAIRPSLAEQASRADRDLRLDDVVARSEGVALRIQQH